MAGYSGGRGIAGADSLFREMLRATGAEDRGAGRWIFVPYDQLSDRVGPLAASDPAESGVVLVESEAWLRRRPWHRQKLALVLASQRRFALEQAAQGRAVRYILERGTFREALAAFAAVEGPLAMAEAAERELRREVAPLVADGRIEVSPHTGWLTDDDDFAESQPAGGPWRMDGFYRHVRRRTGLLMTRGRPDGGKYSFDTQNRRAWDGDPPPPAPPRFRPCDIVREVAREIDLRYGDHPGRVDAASLPASRSQVDRLWAWALDSCLPAFGPYEDAMSTRSTGLFHTRISAVLNLHRLLPSRVVDDVTRADLPLPSREGFVRQVLGWREFVRHVHLRTDGFRRLPGGEVLPVPSVPGDGGRSCWAGVPWPTASPAPGGDGGVSPRIAAEPMGVPAAWWGVRSGLNCLDTVVASVWDEGYSHHITRLMILSNLATLLDVSPRELTDWFWAAYTDAYDWVVEPNVLGMGTFAIGELMTTKPYISGAAYIHRMSDYCAGCAFDPRADCPITRLYWAWIDRHGDRIEKNRRMAMPLRSARRRAESERRIDARTVDWVRSVLAEGRMLDPAEAPAADGRRGGKRP